MLRVLFVCQFDFSAAGEKQVLGFAQQLARRGHSVMIMIGGDAASARREGADRVPGLTVHPYAFARGHLRAADRAAAQAFAPALVHAWNSRSQTIGAARDICAATGAPLFVHFEDDEWRLPEHPPGTSARRRVGQLGRRALSRFDPSLWWHSTRASLGYVAAAAAGLDALTPTLAAEVHERLGRPCATVLPVTPEPAPGEAGREDPAPPLPTGEPVALITGTIWPAYLPDFMVGFGAIADLLARGHPVRLVHAGHVHPDWSGVELAASAGVPPEQVTFLGYLPYAAIPGLLRAADILLQPGPPSRFNRLRLPSKLQAYLESGTPTVTFGVGFGELLTDRTEALLTHTGDPSELADRIEELLTDAALRDRLSTGGPAAARRLFDPARNTAALLAHYATGLG